MYRSRILPKIRRMRLLHDVSIELTYDCNLNCFFCYNDRKKKGKLLSLAQYKTLLRDLAEMQTLFLMITGGEPLIHPHFFDIGRFARELGFVITVRTNGHNLDRKTAERMRKEVDPYLVEVSLHGATADVHDRQTRLQGSFERLINNITTAGNAGLRLGVVTTPTTWNEHQIKKMFELCDSLNVPLRFQGPVSPRDNGDTSPLVLTPAAETWQRIRSIKLAGIAETETGDGDRTVAAQECDSTGAVTEPKATCSLGVGGVDIDPYGNVRACMHLQTSAGNLHRQSIADIWNTSPLFEQARMRSVEAARQFNGTPLKQFGAPLFCLAAAENCTKGSTRYE